MTYKLATASLICVSMVASAVDRPKSMVGTILSKGKFQIAHSEVTGTATALSGDLIETAEMSSRIMLRDGSELELTPHSSGAVYLNHADLIGGTLRTQLKNQFYINSQGFMVRATSARTDAVLQVAESGLTVSVPGGNADVLTANGDLLAHMSAGNTLNFESLAGTGGAPAGAPPPPYGSAIRLIGVLDSSNGHFLVRDRFTNSVSEVTGDVPQRLKDRLVMVEGDVMPTTKSSLGQVDRLVRARSIKASEATTAIPCAFDGSGGVAKRLVLDGALSKVDSHFVLRDRQRGAYEVVGAVNDGEVGSVVHVKGVVLPKTTEASPAERVIYAEKRKFIALNSPCVGAIVGGALVTTGVVLIPNSAAAANARPISF